MLPLYSSMELAPTEFALRLRLPFAACLLALLMLVVGKFAIRDWWGGVNLIFMVLLGSFVLAGQYHVNASSALFYCLVSLISGVFDIISCILYFQHSKYKLMDARASSLALLAQCVFILSPVALFISAYVSYAIFSDCRDHAQEMRPFAFGGAQEYFAVAAAVASSANGPGPQQQQAEAQAASARPSEVLLPFSGTGRRLAEVLDASPSSGKTRDSPRRT